MAFRMIDSEATMLTGVPAHHRLSFKALRNGAALGTHDVTFSRKDNLLEVEIAIDYQVKLGFLTVFRYRLRGAETWSGDTLMSARADTEENGKTHRMRAMREGDALMVEGSKSGRYRAPVGAIVASHWNPAQLAAPMINPQDGSLLTFTVEARGPARITDSAGRVRAATRYALTGPEGLDLWYGEDGQWASLQAKAPDGSTISYLPLA